MRVFTRTKVRRRSGTWGGSGNRSTGPVSLSLHSWYGRARAGGSDDVTGQTHTNTHTLTRIHGWRTRARTFTPSLLYSPALALSSLSFCSRFFFLFWEAVLGITQSIPPHHPGSFSGLEQEAKKKNNNKTPDTNRTVYPQHTLTFLERQRETSLCASPVRLSTCVFINPRLCYSSHLSHRGKEGLTARTDIPRDVAGVLGRSIKENPDHGKSTSSYTLFLSSCC